jgi:hypothetical protein
MLAGPLAVFRMLDMEGSDNLHVLVIIVTIVIQLSVDLRL